MATKKSSKNGSAKKKTANGNGHAVALKIEKGVPIPATMRKGGPPRFPFDKMSKNESFLIANADKKAEISLRSSAHYFGKKNDLAFSVKRTEEGVRCWRVG